MKYEIFSRKMRLIDRLQGQLSGYVWEIFDKYIEEKNISFSSPSDWNYSLNRIWFTGEDGCRGCYDRKSLEIPMRYFENFEKCILEDREEALKKQVDEKVKNEVSIKLKELAELERLKKKYANSI